MRTGIDQICLLHNHTPVGMKPLSERDENPNLARLTLTSLIKVGMKPLSERDENYNTSYANAIWQAEVGMKPLSERDENIQFY